MKLRHAAPSVALLALVFLALPVSGAPRDEVLRLVPDDVGFCLVLQDLRSHAETFLSSPFAEQFYKSPLGQALGGSAEIQKLAAVDKDLQKQFGIGAARFRDDLLGDVVVLAYRPSPDGKPEGEQGVMLLRARDAALLARLVDRLNELQKQSGELTKLQSRKHLGTSYHARVQEHSEQFYYLNGPVLAFSSQELLLKQVIELDQKETRERPGLAERMRRLNVHEALGTLWINPRAFDAELERKAVAAKPPEVHGIRRMQAYWKALDGIAATFSPRKDGFEFGLAFQGREDDMPAPARKFFAGDNRPSELWSVFPSDAMLSVAGKVDVMALVEFLGDFVPADEQRKLRERLLATRPGGLDVMKDVLPNLGPDWGICVLAPEPTDKAIIPPVVAALRVRPGDKERKVDSALFEALDLFAGLAVFANAELTLKSVHHDKTEVKYLHSEKGSAAGIQPSYALKGGYLLLATTPAALLRLKPAAPPPEAAACPLLRISFRQLRGYLKPHLDVLASHVASQHQIPAEEAKRRLERLVQVCELLDRLELSRHTAPGQVSLNLRVRTEQPGAK